MRDFLGLAIFNSTKSQNSQGNLRSQHQ